MAKEQFTADIIGDLGFTEDQLTDEIGDETIQKIFDWCNEQAELFKAQFDSMGSTNGIKDGRGTGKLRQSIIPLPAERFGDQYQVVITAESYWKFLEYGVRGARSSKKAPNSPFAYSSKYPPLQAIIDWGNSKGIFTDYSGIEDIEEKAKDIQKRIFNAGIKPRPFRDPALTEQRIQELMESVADATIQVIKEQV